MVGSSLSPYSSLPWAVFQTLSRHRQLVWQMSKRDVLGRYRGSILGLLWSFLHPLVMLAIYTFVFAFVFKVRWDTDPGNKLSFALILFAGLIIHSLFAENLTRAPGLIVSNVNFVKRVVFPLETLPSVTLFSALFHALVSLAVLLGFYLVVHLSLQWTALLLPLVIFPLALVAMGISWFLASLGVYIRDMGQVTGIAVTILLFLSPIFYLVSAIPEPFRKAIYVNPLTFIIEQSRNVLLFGKLLDFPGLAIYLVCSIFIAWLGLLWFQKTRKGFADVL